MPVNLFRRPFGVSRRVLLALPLAALATGAAAQNRRLPVSELAVITSKARHIFKVELAADDASRTRGLMHRRTLPPDAGMLFDYGREVPGVAMWMRNTLIPLDMLFIKADGRILNIHERAVPHDLTSISAAGPVRAVLEVNGGTVSRLGIRPGDRIEHPLFR